MNFINRIGAAVSAYGGPDFAWRLATGLSRRPVVLTYHRVLSSSDEVVDKTQRDVTKGEFRAHVKRLLSRRRPVTLYDIVKGEIGDGQVFAITFDDGYGDNFRTAAPILRELGVPAAVFVTTDPVSGRGWLWWDRLAYALTLSVGKSVSALGRNFEIASEADVWTAQAELTRTLKRATDRGAVIREIAEQSGMGNEPPPGLYLTWDDVRALRDDGWEIGAHTRSHRILTSLPREDAEIEIDECAREITDETGTGPRLFAYPNGRPGDFDDGIIAHLKETGFVGACASDAGPESNEPDPFAVKRIAPKGGEPASVFRLRVSGLYYKLRR
ncbi:MAG: polysaccharide deacetylase family protein [Candidatus Coatesbacteria bacterium]|nr:MAG: polysaccharide deacetylase family protein [Candidatus Coatesbacteria bacterium]